MPVAASFQARGGETSWPSPVYFLGIGCPSPNAVLVTAMPFVVDFIGLSPFDEGEPVDVVNLRAFSPGGAGFSTTCDVQEAVATQAKQEAAIAHKLRGLLIAFIDRASRIIIDANKSSTRGLEQ